MLRFKSIIFTAASLLALPAQAAIVTANFTGVISQGTDVTGYFTGISGYDLSAPGSIVSPPLISGTFSYDTDTVPSDGSGFYMNDGITDWLGFTVAIAGQTYSFGLIDPADGNFQSAFVADDPDDLNLSSQRAGSNGSETVGLDLSGEEFLTGTDLPLHFTYQSTAGGTGFFVIQTDAATVDAVFSITCASTEIACPNPQIGGSVPEPSSWLMLLAGFGLTGAAIRRRRRLAPRLSG